MVAHQIDGTMLQHGKVFTLYHASYERLGRIIGGVVLTFVAYSSCAFYLLVDASSPGFCNQISYDGLCIFIAFCSFVLIAKVHFFMHTAK